MNFNPNGNYQFTFEEFTNAKSRDKLPLKCLCCGKTFYTAKNMIQAQLRRNELQTINPKSIRDNKFCSQKCVHENRCKEKIKCNCSNCNKELTRLPKKISESGKIFCSQHCAAIYNNAHKKTGVRRSKLEIFLEQKLPKVFPNLEIKYNDREMCDSLELDLYIPSLNIAFELNGPVHYQPVFGKTQTEKNEYFNHIRKKDIKKQELCQQKDINLYIIDVSNYKHITTKKNEYYLDLIKDCILENM